MPKKSSTSCQARRKAQAQTSVETVAKRRGRPAKEKKQPVPKKAEPAKASKPRARKSATGNKSEKPQASVAEQAGISQIPQLQHNNEVIGIEAPTTSAAPSRAQIPEVPVVEHIERHKVAAYLNRTYLNRRRLRLLPIDTHEITKIAKKCRVSVRELNIYFGARMRLTQLGYGLTLVEEKFEYECEATQKLLLQSYREDSMVPDHERLSNLVERTNWRSGQICRWFLDHKYSTNQCTYALAELEQGWKDCDPPINWEKVFLESEDLRKMFTQLLAQKRLCTELELRLITKNRSRIADLVTFYHIQRDQKRQYEEKFAEEELDKIPFEVKKNLNIYFHYIIGRRTTDNQKIEDFIQTSNVNIASQVLELYFKRRKQTMEGVLPERMKTPRESRLVKNEVEDAPTPSEIIRRAMEEATSWDPPENMATEEGSDPSPPRVYTPMEIEQESPALEDWGCREGSERSENLPSTSAIPMDTAPAPPASESARSSPAMEPATEEETSGSSDPSPSTSDLCSSMHACDSPATPESENRVSEERSESSRSLPPTVAVCPATETGEDPHASSDPSPSTSDLRSSMDADPATEKRATEERSESSRSLPPTVDVSSPPPVASSSCSPYPALLASADASPQVPAWASARSSISRSTPVGRNIQAHLQPKLEPVDDEIRFLGFKSASTPQKVEHKELKPASKKLHTPPSGSLDWKTWTKPDVIAWAKQFLDQKYWDTISLSDMSGRDLAEIVLGGREVSRKLYWDFQYFEALRVELHAVMNVFNGFELETDV
ncbi:SAM domain-containing protein [Caenorhabditis elegans]|uniref:SAM domain-containing protein n=1 Tax=Caenorhabditis elegans TaxID=6239 RepID=H2L0L1_CAEEL|nr:SAM domain-containing protein [Caenorhabditis elegans]CCD73594.1 SAM domain-containing protein [Caenorhabditis elegans]|eukprot:NP_001254060.1 Uncharacterized protein CELE_T10D4.6 [Caenorhabditis elegans]